MNNLCNYLLFSITFIMSSQILGANPHHSCKEIYLAQGFASGWKYKEELALIEALEQHGLSSGFYQKYAQQIEKFPFPHKHAIDLLRIGFNEQIFCKPWVLKLPEIFQKLRNGEFSNALIRELNRYQNKAQGLPSLSSYSYFVKLERSIEKISSPFPKEIHIRDPHRHDLTNNFFYFLRKEDGKIFIKPNPRKGNKADVLKSGVLEHYQEGDKLGNLTEWNLFNGNGGPTLDGNRKVVQFAVASEIVLVLDNFGQFHIFKPTEFKTPTQWTTNIGCPIGEKLYIPREHKGWSFSCSLKIKPEVRRSIEFMHPDDIVSYYEDADNKKIESGFTATAYVLSKDGRKIYFWDTGLAATFARAFTTPHRGNFVVDNLSAAGSTIMVIGKNSDAKKEIYIRMFDYEINGACPGEQHTYQQTQCPDPDRILGLLEAKRKLPLPGWKKMPDIPLLGDDFISNQISIELRGQGNDARLLKVRGTKNGESGYYQKMLKDSQWEFIPTLEDNLVPESNDTLENSGDLGRNDMDYKGKIFSFSSLDPSSIAKVELKNFHYFLGCDEPSSIVITTARGTVLSLDFHTNDSWTLTTQKKRREDLIGNKDGEAKPLLGTLIIPDVYLNSNDPDLLPLVEMFRPFHMKMNAFGVMASDEGVAIKSVQKFIDMDDNYKTIILPDILMKFTRSEDRPGYYAQMIAKERYFVKDLDDLGEVRKVIRLNQELGKLLEQDKRELVRENLKNSFLAGGANIAFQIGEKVLSFSDNTLINSLRKFLTHAAAQYEEMNLQVYFSPKNTNQAIEKSKTEVEERIKMYRGILESKNLIANPDEEAAKKFPR